MPISLAAVILDANQLPDATAISGAVCIVGAGPVGIALALRLAELGRDVLLLEAGGEKRSDGAQQFYRGAVTDPALHYPLDEYRERRFGGTSTIWGGRCMPLDPIDYEQRDWISASGWPIGPAVLAPYYPRANALCEAGAFAYTVDEAFGDARRPMIAGFSGAHYTSDTLERFSCPTDFGRRYRDRLAQSPRIRVLLGAAVTDIALNEQGTAVRHLRVRTVSGSEIDVTAGSFVLAAGGLETTRLLLASRDVQPNGIGNQHDVLGRYYMCHLAGTIGAFHAASAVWHGYDIADDGSYCRRRLAITAQAQREHRIGNFVARLHHPRIADPAHGSSILSALYLGRALIPRWYRKRLADDGVGGIAATMRHGWNIARDPFAVAGFARQMLFDRRLAERKFPSVIVAPKSHVYSLDFHAEQEPNVDSRVSLGTERDAWGMPRLEVDWRYTRGDVATVETALALLADDLARSNSGRFDYDPATVEGEMTRYGAYGGHHIGTARMGDDPRHSVVDAHCRVHGVANLHLAGAAVFPTSSQANPTMTAIALALRLADRLCGDAV